MTSSPLRTSPIVRGAWVATVIFNKPPPPPPDNVPEIEVRLLGRAGDKPLGAGETSSGPSVAAIANAIHDATSLRLRRMPFSPDAIRAAAMADDG